MTHWLKTILLAALFLSFQTVTALAQEEITALPEMRFEALPQRAVHPADNQSTPAKVALGRLLFFDPILSATRKVSCATCHHPQHGWADGRSTPIGIGGIGIGPNRLRSEAIAMTPLLRNVPTIINVAFNGLVSGVPYNPLNAPMFWDARAHGLESQTKHPISTAAEMRGHIHPESQAVKEAANRVANIPEYRSLFDRAGETEKAISPQSIAKMLAAFERSLIATNAPFDRFMRGAPSALNAAQQRGMKLFEKAGCLLCHGGPMFSDYKLHNIGVNVIPGERAHEFRTPTLRNLAHTAPYMHNGSLRSLEDVLNFYDLLSDQVSETLDGGDTSTYPPLDPLLRRLQLTPEDFPDLIAFIESLNDLSYDQTQPQKVPSGLKVGGE